MNDSERIQNLREALACLIDSQDEWLGSLRVDRKIAMTKARMALRIEFDELKSRERETIKDDLRRCMEGTAPPGGGELVNLA